MRRLEHVMEQDIALKVNAVTRMYVLVSINNVLSVTEAFTFYELTMFLLYGVVWGKPEPP